MTKFKMTLKKSAAVLAAAALTISGLTGIGSEGIFKSKTEIVSAAYAENTYNVDYGICIDNNGLQKCFYDGVDSTYEPFSGDGISWDKDSNTLTLTNFDFTTSVYNSGNSALSIEVCDYEKGIFPDITIKLFGKNTIGIVHTGSTILATPLSISYSNLTIEGPGSLEINGKNSTFGYTLSGGGDITINNCDVSAEGNINVYNGKKISINNAKVSADGGFKTFNDEGNLVSYSPIVNGADMAETANSYDGRFLSTQPNVVIKSVKIYLEADPTMPEANVGTVSSNTPKVTCTLPDSSKYSKEETGNKINLTIEPKSLNEPFKTESITINDENSKLDLTINNFTYPSIADILTNIVLTSTNSEQIERAKNWLNYASAAQSYFEYDTDKLANRYLTESDRQTTSKGDVIRAIRSKYATGIAQIDPAKSEGYEYVGTTLILGYEPIRIKNYYTYTGTASNPSNLDETTIDGKKYYHSEFSCLEPSNADKIGTSCGYYDYIYSTLRNSEEDEKLVNLCCAIYDMGF